MNFPSDLDTLVEVAVLGFTIGVGLAVGMGVAAWLRGILDRESDRRRPPD